MQTLKVTPDMLQALALISLNSASVSVNGKNVFAALRDLAKKINDMPNDEVLLISKSDIEDCDNIRRYNPSLVEPLLDALTDVSGNECLIPLWLAVKRSKNGLVILVPQAMEERDLVALVSSYMRKYNDEGDLEVFAEMAQRLSSSAWNDVLDTENE